MSENFVFTPIDDIPTLRELTQELVGMALVTQRTFQRIPGSTKRTTIQHLFDIRKQGITALLDMIQQYIDQIPEEEIVHTKQDVEIDKAIENSFTALDIKGEIQLDDGLEKSGS